MRSPAIWLTLVITTFPTGSASRGSRGTAIAARVGVDVSEEMGVQTSIG
ncbi:MAG: hypothetical protein QOE20_4362 [Mycobacterium sp.]|nr:hypothetical protein [Mycobacterium sp.]